MRTDSNIKRPISLRQPGAAILLGLSATTLAGAPAHAQQQGQEVELDTLKIEGRTADVNPYAQEGAPYKANRSGDSRRVKPLAQTPTTITVVTETQVKESGQSDLKDILRLQPGVTVGTGENGNAFGDRYVIRGQEMRSDVFVDGLRDTGMTVRESFAVEQVELTKGPSGSFAGRGASGGAVNVITKQASTDYNFVNAELGAGTNSHFRGAADVNWKLNDTLAFRINGVASVEDVPGRDPADRKRLGAAVSALLKPTETLSILLDYYHLTAKDRPDLGSRFNAQGGKVVQRPPVATQANDFIRSFQDAFTGRVKWQASDWLRVENATRYGMSYNEYVTTGFNAANRAATDPIAPGAWTLTLDAGHQGWQQVRYLVNQTNLYADFTALGDHKLVLGAEISDHRVVNGQFNLRSNNPANCLTGAGAGTANYCVFGAPRVQDLRGRTEIRTGWDQRWRMKSRSLYLMDTVDVAPWLTLFGGVRADKYTFNLRAQNPNTWVLNSVDNAKDTLWHFHGGATFKPSDDGNIYVAFSTGRDVNGGESDVGRDCSYGGLCSPTNARNDLGKAERTTNLEIGTKWELFDHRLLLTAAAFKTIKADVFEADSNLPGFGYGATGTLNSGRHKVEGVELGFVGNITDKLSGQASVTLMTSNITRSNNPANIGLMLANFANRQATAQLRYQFTDRFALGGTVTYKSKMHTGQPDTAANFSPAFGDYTYTLPGYVTLDLFANYKLNDKLEARLNVKNATNKDYYLAAYRSGSFVYIGDRRTATLTLAAKF